MLGEVLERKRTRNSSAISCYSGAIFSNSGAIPKSVQSQRSAPQSVRLHVFAFTVSRALICYESSSKHLRINGSCRHREKHLTLPIHLEPDVRDPFRLKMNIWSEPGPIIRNVQGVAALRSKTGCTKCRLQPAASIKFRADHRQSGYLAPHITSMEEPGLQIPTVQIHPTGHFDPPL